MSLGFRMLALLLLVFLTAGVAAAGMRAGGGTDAAACVLTLPFLDGGVVCEMRCTCAALALPCLRLPPSLPAAATLRCCRCAPKLRMAFRAGCCSAHCTCLTLLVNAMCCLDSRHACSEGAVRRSAGPRAGAPRRLPRRHPHPLSGGGAGLLGALVAAAVCDGDPNQHQAVRCSSGSSSGVPSAHLHFTSLLPEAEAREPRVEVELSGSVCDGLQQAKRMVPQQLLESQPGAASSLHPCALASLVLRIRVPYCTFYCGKPLVFDTAQGRAKS